MYTDTYIILHPVLGLSSFMRSLSYRSNSSFISLSSNLHIFFPVSLQFLYLVEMKITSNSLGYSGRGRGSAPSGNSSNLHHPVGANLHAQSSLINTRTSHQKAGDGATEGSVFSPVYSSITGSRNLRTEKLDGGDGNSRSLHIYDEQFPPLSTESASSKSKNRHFNRNRPPIGPRAEEGTGVSSQLQQHVSVSKENAVNQKNQIFGSSSMFKIGYKNCNRFLVDQKSEQRMENSSPRQCELLSVENAVDENSVQNSSSRQIECLAMKNAEGEDCNQRIGKCESLAMQTAEDEDFRRTPKSQNKYLKNNTTLDEQNSKKSGDTSFLQCASSQMGNAESQQDKCYEQCSSRIKGLTPHGKRPKNYQYYPKQEVDENPNSYLPEEPSVNKPFDIFMKHEWKRFSSKPSLPSREMKIWRQVGDSTDGRSVPCNNMGDWRGFENSRECNGQVLRPGMVLLKKYITLGEQIEIVKKCREIGIGEGGFYQPSYRDGAKLRLHMMCLGLNWDVETRKYEDVRPFDGSKPPSIPHEFCLLVKRAIQDSHALIAKDSGEDNVQHILPTMSPNICIVNFYKRNGRLGLHQDRDESRASLCKGLPVVSISVGDEAEFLYGDQRDVEKAETVLLESGDVLIFGGKSRHIFHGVSSVIPNSTPAALVKETSIRPGRLNLTFRQY